VNIFPVEKVNEDLSSAYCGISALSESFLEWNFFHVFWKTFSLGKLSWFFQERRALWSSWPGCAGLL